MAAILFGIYSVFIVIMTVYFLIRVFIIAYNREEISLRKFKVMVTSSVVIGSVIAFIIFIGSQNIVNMIV